MMQEQWRALEDMYHANKTRAIGVSNFCAPCLECIAKTATVTPAVNQLQFHVRACVRVRVTRVCATVGLWNCCL